MTQPETIGQLTVAILVLYTACVIVPFAAWWACKGRRYVNRLTIPLEQEAP